MQTLGATVAYKGRCSSEHGCARPLATSRTPITDLAALCVLEPMHLCGGRHRALLDYAVKRVLLLFDRTRDAELRVLAAYLVGFYCHYSGDWQRLATDRACDRGAGGHE